MFDPDMALLNHVVGWLSSHQPDEGPANSLTGAKTWEVWSTHHGTILGTMMFNMV